MSELIDRETVREFIKSYRHSTDVAFDMEKHSDEIPAASPWHRVEDDPPDEKTDAIFYYEWTGISGTVYKETSIISLEELMALGCRPIAWMEKPEPPKEEEHGN